MQTTLQTPVEQLPYVGPNYVKRLKKLGIHNVRDLIFHFPHRYDDFSKIIYIKDIELGQKVTIQGKILEIKSVRTFRRKMTLTEAIVEDNTGAVKAVWFNQPYLIDSLFKGQVVSLSGKAKVSKDELILSSPAYEVLRSKSSSTLHTARLVPVYPETESLSSRWLRYKIQSVLYLASMLSDFLPLDIKKNQKLLDLPKAIKEIHFPQNETLAKEAKRRLAFNELFLIQLFSQIQKNKWQKQKARVIKFPEKIIKDFVDLLPFKLTNAQRAAAWQIFKDIEKPTPMNRLLEGDVGSGKTVVAAMAALAAIHNGFQVALMSPTEILAKQHFDSISKLFERLNITMGILTGSEASTNKKEKVKKNNLIKETADGDVKLLVGTHSLIQDRLEFKNLALVIIDEQHRFGVEQRAKLQQQITDNDKGKPSASFENQTLDRTQRNKKAPGKITPHLLTMTATPIPRTLALTIYGDLDLSILDEMPIGRQKIITKVVAPVNRKLAYEFARNQIKQGRQVFVICPRIESESGSESNNIGSHFMKNLLNGEVRAVKEEYEKLSKKIYPESRVGMLHGKLKPKEKDEVMEKFKNKEVDILVSTSVIEVGIDIPNATVMLIEGSERFGLAQLYQFRGRVGRSQYQSYCFLFTDSTSTTTHKRLKAIVNAKNGFELAQKDLEIRGPGQFLGTRQWGMPDLTMASITDQELIQQTKDEAQKLLKQDSELKKYPLLQEELKNFQEQIHFE